MKYRIGLGDHLTGSSGNLMVCVGDTCTKSCATSSLKVVACVCTPSPLLMVLRIDVIFLVFFLQSSSWTERGGEEGSVEREHPMMGWRWWWTTSIGWHAHVLVSHPLHRNVRRLSLSPGALIL